MRTENLRPARKALKISFVLLLSYYLLFIITALFVIAPLEDDALRAFTSLVLFASINNAPVVVFYVVLFILLKRLIRKSAKGLKPLGVLTFIYGIGVLALRPSSETRDVIQHYALLSMPEVRDYRYQLAIFISKTPPPMSATMIALNIYAIFCTVIFIAAIVLLMLAYALIWYEHKLSARIDTE